MATHSSTLAWKIPWTEEPNQLQSMGLKVSDTTKQLSSIQSLNRVQLSATPFTAACQASMSSSNCCFLTYIQIFQEAGQVIWYSHVFQNFPQFVAIHTVKGFQFSSVPQSCLSLQPHGLGPGLPVHHQLLEFTQTHVH